VFDEEVRDYRPPTTRSGNLMAVLHTIDRATAAHGTNLDKPFRQFAGLTSHRGMVAVISDFYCDAEQMIASVRPLAFRGQDIVLFHLLDPGEINLKFDEATLLEDAETGNAVEVSGQFIREGYSTRMQQHIDAIRKAAAGVGADHVLVNTNEPLDQALRNYLMFRQRRK
jgi:hypothetical protein